MKTFNIIILIIATISIIAGFDYFIHGKMIYGCIATYFGCQTWEITICDLAKILNKEQEKNI